MLEFNASAFFEVTMSVQHTLTAIGDKKSLIEHPDGAVTIAPIADVIFLRAMRERATELRAHLEVLGAEMTLKELTRLERCLGEGNVTYEGLTRFYNDICSRLSDELSLRQMFVLERDEQRFFQPQRPLFGDDFDQKFRTYGQFELDEAAKCLALARPTAAVFHLMRVLEVGIGALAACLGIPDPVKPAERNWGVILRKIMEDGIQKKWATAAARMQPDAVLLESLHASLDAIKNPWRNEVMHVEGKYTDDEAQHIFAAVRGFMKKLASRMDENGEPKA